MRMGDFWYRGTADSVFQNLHLVQAARAVGAREAVVFLKGSFDAPAAAVEAE